MAPLLSAEHLIRFYSGLFVVVMCDLSVIKSPLLGLLLCSALLIYQYKLPVIRFALMYLYKFACMFTHLWVFL